MKKNFIFAVVMVLMLTLLTACGSSNENSSNQNSTTSQSSSSQNATEGNTEKKTLIVGTSADYPPFEYIDTANSDEIIGFDIELIKLIGEKLGYEVKVENMDFNSLITALQAKKFDVVIAGMTPTPEREEVVDFSIPYYETEQYFIFKADKGYTSPADIAGGVVGAQLSSIQEEIALNFGEQYGFKVESRNLIPELIQEIKIGRLDAAVIENIVSENFLALDSELAAFPIEMDDPDYKAIVFQKGSPLKAEFDKVIEELHADGTIDQLKKKWIVVEE